MILFHHRPYIPLRITSPFGPRNTGIPGASTFHQGVDIGTDKSKPYTNTDGGSVTAVLPGVVISNYYNNSRGWVILLDHGVMDGKHVKTLYQHLKQTGASVGKKVKAGDQIGIMGNTGVGAQLHLHFELRLNDVCVDPEPYLKNIKPEEDETMEKRYNKISEIPEGLRKETQSLIDIGALRGNENGVLNVTEDMLRSMIVAKRYADCLVYADRITKSGGIGI